MTEGVASHPAVDSPGTPDVLERLGQRVRHLRHLRGLTLRALANRSGLSPRFLMSVEAGRGNISVRRLADLALALQATPSQLLSSRPAGTPSTVIALLGLRGSGKTTIGRRLARQLRLRFVELDRQVELRAGMSLGEIFSLHGEAYYRQIERDALADLLAGQRAMVLAVGGGLVTAPETFATLQQHATTVWLKARTEDYWERVIQQGDRRPMDQHPQARDALQQLVSRRNPLYAEAHLTVDTAGLTVPRATEAALQALAADGLEPGS